MYCDGYKMDLDTGVYTNSRDGVWTVGDYRSFESIEEDYNKYVKEIQVKSEKVRTAASKKVETAASKKKLEASLKKIETEASQNNKSVVHPPIKFLSEMKDKLVIEFLPPDPLHCLKLGPANDVFTYLEAQHPVIMQQHYEETPVNKRMAGMPGSAWNGVQLDKLMTENNLAKLVSRLPAGSHGAEIGQYLGCVRDLYHMSVRTILPDNHKEIHQDYVTAAENLFKLGIISKTLKLHIIEAHLIDLLQAFGCKSLQQTNGSYIESAHSAIKDTERTHRTQTSNQRGRNPARLKKTLVYHNSPKWGFTMAKHQKKSKIRKLKCAALLNKVR